MIYELVLIYVRNWFARYTKTIKKIKNGVKNMIIHTSEVFGKVEQPFDLL